MQVGKDPFSSIIFFFLPEILQRVLQSDWMSSLQSAYQLVKARQCPYFYLLAPNFTVLFQAAGTEMARVQNITFVAGVAGTQELSALVVPSTSGL